MFNILIILFNSGHLHTGNILLEPNTSNIKLTDLANNLLGLPYFFRQYIIENRKIQVNIKSNISHSILEY